MVAVASAEGMRAKKRPKAKKKATKRTGDADAERQQSALEDGEGVSQDSAPRKKMRRTKEEWAAFYTTEANLRQRREREAQLSNIAKGMQKAARKSKKLGEGLIPEVQDLVDRRAKARLAKDWQTSDVLRDALALVGYTVSDVKGEQILKKTAQAV